MESLLIFFLLLVGVYSSLRKGFYDGIVYGLVHKKIAIFGGAGLQQQFRYGKQAILKGWSFIILVGIPILFYTYAMYMPIRKFNPFFDAKAYFKDQYYVIELIAYGIIAVLIVEGGWWMYIGIRHGIIERKTKTGYHLSYGGEHLRDGHKKIHRHIYFRGKRAYKTGIARTVLGTAYTLVALLLFLDRDYYVYHAKKSIYPNVFERMHHAHLDMNSSK